MRYAVEVTSGNGYHCSCCRSVSEDIEEFDTLEEAQRYIAEIEFKAENYKSLRELKLCREDDDDRHVSDFYEIGEHLNHENDEAVKAFKEELMAEFKENEIEALAERKRKDAENRRMAEVKRHELYESMKAEYEGVK